MAEKIVVACLASRAAGKSLRTVARELGLPESSAPLLSKALRGLPISADSERTIGRALGVIPPPRKLERVAPSKEHRARRAALGVPWAQVIEAGLRSLEAPPP